MKILLVCNNAYTKGNGMCTAILDLKRRLLSAGHEVRLIAAENPSPDGPQPEYALEHFVFPIFEPIIAYNGFRYAKLDKKMMKEAIQWADVIHLEEAFPLQIFAARMAKKLDKPCVASYHLYAENILANLGMGLKCPINPIVTWFWKILVYNHCSDLHCPSQVVCDHLRSFGYKAKMHVISNGIDLPDEEIRAVEPQTSPYLILCIGRLSNEKSQTTLLNAMKYSKYAHQIQLVFAGKGPKQTKYQKHAQSLVDKGVLKYAPQFGFYTHEELAELARKSYLYIHCAWVEVEGLSCLEAIKEGTVPVIGQGPLVATPEFALDERSIYPVKDSRALAEKIDYWIEHPQERMKMGQLYADSTRKYSADKSTEAILEMYKAAMK